MTILAAALLAFGFGGKAAADSIASQFPVGATFEGAVQVSRTQVPLPPGKWTVTALDETRNNNNNVNATLTLTNIISSKFLGHLSISTNVDINRGGWVLNQFCGRRDVYFMQFDAMYQKEQACWGINHLIMDPTSTYKPAYGKNIRQVLADQSIDMPRVMITTLFRLANESSYLTYEIVLNTEYFGFSAAGESNWASSSWHKDLIAKDPKRQQFLEQIKAQHAAFYPILKAQFR
ncbi:hypothetical protein GAY33_10720 [Azospirillum brasilense]|uniref:hypothetical protein n=1 Tax=Azospirillum argentinense TaxID=2970906 RepID=UPI001909824D|nr:hypothetical protein [Azospirillum argentinense]MBK3799698.1 hypothetical protein [Azospirillum argentinense]